MGIPPQAVHSAEFSGSPDFSESPQVAEVVLSPDVAVIEKENTRSPLRKVILIRDVHESPEAQRNIEKIIRYFAVKEKADWIGVEGSWGEMNPLFYRACPDQERLRKIFDQLANRSEVTGSILSAVFTAPESLVFHGIENKRLYKEGLHAYLAGDEQKAEILSLLELEGQILTEEKRKHYPPAWLPLDKELEKWHSTHQNFEKIFSRLAKWDRPARGSPFGIFYEKITRETHFSKSLNAEIDQLEKVLSKALWNGFEALRALQAQKQAMQTGALSKESYWAWLYQLAQERGVVFQYSRNFRKAVALEKRFQMIPPEEFLDAFSKWSFEVERKALRTPQQKSLQEASKRLFILRKLAHFELGAGEIDELFKLERMGKVPEIFKNHKNFYAIARKRDEIFAENIARKFDGYPPQKERTVLFLAGGFHTERVANFLNQKGITTVQVRPALSEQPEASLYRQHMRGEVSWSQSLEHKEEMLYDNFQQAICDLLLSQGEDYRLFLKAWRDGIVRALGSRSELSHAGFFTSPIMEKLEEFKTRHEEKRRLAFEGFLKGLDVLKRSGKLNSQSAGLLLKTHFFAPASTGPLLLTPMRSEIRISHPKWDLTRIRRLNSAVKAVLPGGEQIGNNNALSKEALESLLKLQKQHPALFVRKLSPQGRLRLFRKFSAEGLRFAQIELKEYAELEVRLVFRMQGGHLVLGLRDPAEEKKTLREWLIRPDGSVLTLGNINHLRSFYEYGEGAIPLPNDYVRVKAGGPFWYSLASDNKSGKWQLKLDRQWSKGSFDAQKDTRFQTLFLKPKKGNPQVLNGYIRFVHNGKTLNRRVASWKWDSQNRQFKRKYSYIPGTPVGMLENFLKSRKWNDAYYGQCSVHSDSEVYVFGAKRIRLKQFFPPGYQVPDTVMMVQPAGNSNRVDLYEIIDKATLKMLPQTGLFFPDPQKYRFISSFFFPEKLRSEGTQIKDAWRFEDSRDRMGDALLGHLPGILFPVTFWGSSAEKASKNPAVTVKLYGKSIKIEGNFQGKNLLIFPKKPIQEGSREEILWDVVVLTPEFEPEERVRNLEFVGGKLKGVPLRKSDRVLTEADKIRINEVLRALGGYLPDEKGRAAGLKKTKASSLLLEAGESAKEPEEEDGHAPERKQAVEQFKRTLQSGLLIPSEVAAVAKEIAGHLNPGGIIERLERENSLEGDSQRFYEKNLEAVGQAVLKILIASLFSDGGKGTARSEVRGEGRKKKKNSSGAEMRAARELKPLTIKEGVIELYGFLAGPLQFLYGWQSFFLGALNPGNISLWRVLTGVGERLLPFVEEVRRGVSLNEKNRKSASEVFREIKRIFTAKNLAEALTHFIAEKANIDAVLTALRNTGEITKADFNERNRDLKQLLEITAKGFKTYWEQWEVLLKRVRISPEWKVLLEHKGKNVELNKPAPLTSWGYPLSEEGNAETRVRWLYHLKEKWMEINLISPEIKLEVDESETRRSEEVGQTLVVRFIKDSGGEKGFFKFNLSEDGVVDRLQISENAEKILGEMRIDIFRRLLLWLQVRGVPLAYLKPAPKSDFLKQALRIWIREGRLIQTDGTFRTQRVRQGTFAGRYRFNLSRKALNLQEKEKGSGNKDRSEVRQFLTAFKIGNYAEAKRFLPGFLVDYEAVGAGPLRNVWNDVPSAKKRAAQADFNFEAQKLALRFLVCV